MNRNLYLMAIAFSGLSLVSSVAVCQTQHPEDRITKLGLQLEVVQKPQNAYLGSVATGGLLYLSGKGPTEKGGKYITGKLGRDMTTVQGYRAAQLIAIAQLSELKAALGDLSRVKRIVKVSGFVNATDDFTRQSQVLDGFSDLMVEVFGEKGRHARTSIGVASLPFGMAVEIEAIVEIEQ